MVSYSEVNRSLNEYNSEAICEVVFDVKEAATIAYMGTRREKDFLKKLIRVGYYRWLAECTEKGFEYLTQALIRFVIAAVPNKKKLFDLPLRNEIRELFMAEYKSKRR